MTLQGVVGAADGVTTHFLTQTYPQIAALVSTPIYYAAVLYWVLYGYKVYAGGTAFKPKDFLAKAIMTVAIFSTLYWNGFAAEIYSAFIDFMESSAATIMAGKPTSQMIDALYSNVDAVSERLRSVDFYQFAMMCDGIILFLINCILFVLAIVYMSIAKFGLAITMLFLPLFIGFLMFEQTKSLFMNWISKMFHFCILYILVIAIVRFGFLAFSDAVDTAGVAAQSGDIVHSEQTAQLIIVEGILILFMLGVRGWASALSGVASSSTGTLIAVIRNLKNKG